LQPRLYALDDHRLPLKRMELVAELGARIYKRIAMNQTLLQLVLDWRWWRPGLRLKPRGEFGQGLRVNRIGFRALE